MSNEAIEARRPAIDYENATRFESFHNLLARTKDRADQLIALGKAGRLSALDKEELPRVVSMLRFVLGVLLDRNSHIAKIDLGDSSWDNLSAANRLRKQLRILRDLDFQHNKLWGTRLARKITAWITEDVPNWYKVTKGKVLDNLSQFLKIAGVAGLLGGGGLALYYWGGSAMASMGTLGRHIGTAGSTLGSVGSSIGRGIGSLWRTIRGN